ncbi:MAG: DinB family protein [Cyclobacteriaceae bacterium]|nr:DinB family protein [Cyclobacteriaceae bacterium]
MNGPELQKRLLEKHEGFIKEIQQLSDNDFLLSVNGKWTAGQQLDHIVRSVGPVKLAFSFPNFALTLIFGKANRPSRTYDGLIEKYNQKLASGGRASGRFIPNDVGVTSRNPLQKKLSTLVNSLNSRIKKKSEEQLDTYILPHPLLGKLTLREMLYFTIYHVEHHHKQMLAHLRNQTIERY